MVFNYENLGSSNVTFDLKKRFEILFDLTKSKNINDFNMHIIQIKREANLEHNFKKLGIDIESSISKIMGGINNQRLINNPIKIDNEIIKKILIKD